MKHAQFMFQISLNTRIEVLNLLTKKKTSQPNILKREGYQSISEGNLIFVSNY